MDSDLLIPIFWTLVIGAVFVVGLKRLSKKSPSNKKWIRPEPNSKKEND
tara:strand:- start:193 stop:339 length:147 start_codon:yes stop_codon:yes gene_type:complete